MPHVIGLIADTHGLLRPRVFDALAGVEVILHAGDVGGGRADTGDILDELATIAPVLAVFGNNDPPGDPRLEERIELTIDTVRILVTHGHELERPRPDALLARYDADVIVYGHTHRQVIAADAGRLAVNPGAAGPRRFDLEPTVARLTIDGGHATAAILPVA